MGRLLKIYWSLIKPSLFGSVMHFLMDFFLKGREDFILINLKMLTVVILVPIFLTGCKETVSTELCETASDTRFEEPIVDTANYPPYSLPIRNESELIKYLPNRGIASCVDINLEDADAAVTADVTDFAALWIKASKFRFFKGEPIMAETEILGLDANRISIVSARLLRDADKEVIAALPAVERSDDTSHKYTLRFDDLGDFTIDDAHRMLIIVDYTIEGQMYATTASIEYYNTTVAELDYVGPAEVIQEHLEIPMVINTSAPGFHSVSGNLYDAGTDTPLVHLSGVKELVTENDVITLQAHISSLKLMGYEGPYVLKDIAIFRGASAPKYTTEPGLVPVPSFSIEGFPFSNYEDIPYVN